MRADVNRPDAELVLHAGDRTTVSRWHIASAVSVSFAIVGLTLAALALLAQLAWEALT